MYGKPINLKYGAQRVALVLACYFAFAASARAEVDCILAPDDCPSDSRVVLGSFSTEAAEVIARITAARTKALQDLQANVISVQRARAVQARADEARALFDQAMAACGPRDVAGGCTLSGYDARALLAKARRLLS